MGEEGKCDCGNVDGVCDDSCNTESEAVDAEFAGETQPEQDPQATFHERLAKEVERHNTLLDQVKEHREEAERLEQQRILSLGKVQLLQELTTGQAS